MFALHCVNRVITLQTFQNIPQQNQQVKCNNNHMQGKLQSLRPALVGSLFQNVNIIAIVIIQ